MVGSETATESSVEWWPMIGLKNLLSHTLKSSNCVPQHIGFIMDGNRRYARKTGQAVRAGHEAGFVSMSKILELCYESGVNTATVFAFSIENFKRSEHEVKALMELAKERIRQLTEHGELAHKYDIRIRVIGEISLLDEDLLEELLKTTEMTKNNKRAVLNICFPYTGREEILHSIKNIISEGIDSKSIDESVVESHLYTGGLPPLDLLIRTSGVSRLSDFMLWQSCRKSTVIEMVDCLWPEFGPARIAWILLKFAFKKSFSSNTTSLEDEDEDEEQLDEAKDGSNRFESSKSFENDFKYANKMEKFQ
ncbi:ditrans,polycis-polyprenyl diphosphate synthase KNAG_0J01170 [Huiozyma naganishii CBS 8797]|uniref:Alkyl transferase n=1 Tax=Huiozyma naganishii (strain ATCC MYA-139 / BCRC 22969 / CBS 8797 / KCTC 17520 / NBRC 10181 / NCYC 3082 / Yp74L-3) TaxID=1071383 RepID=J7RQU8_HUIN7|nr:hypothetical protein KNAG_0J01170 [Kazachstania naganishii CBS 8797]CCK72198.1 hypothetical protein KNAG_0J01170 [Kazachstania naganishii CBS 8797]